MYRVRFPLVLSLSLTIPHVAACGESLNAPTNVDATDAVDAADARVFYDSADDTTDDRRKDGTLPPDAKTDGKVDVADGAQDSGKDATEAGSSPPDAGRDGAPPSLARCSPLPPPPTDALSVRTEPELRSAIASAADGATIVLEDGTYALTDRLAIVGKKGLTLRGRPGRRDHVILRGTGADGACPNDRSLLYVDRSPDLTLSELSLLDAECHAVQVQGTGSHRLRAHRLTLLDSGQQLFKVNGKLTDYSDDGIVECSTIGYSNAIVPAGNTYSQGVDVHGGARWIIRDNIVKNIRSTLATGEAVAGAIALWNGSFDSLVERNWVVDCYMGIQLGGNSEATSHDLSRTEGFQHSGGMVRNNVIVRALDFGIQLARARGGRVDHNTVWTPGYQNSIETRGLGANAKSPHFVRNNLVSGRVGLRDGDTSAHVSLLGNLTAGADWFVSVAGADFRLAPASPAIDAAKDLGADTLTDDFEGMPRPRGAAADVGAYESR